VLGVALNSCGLAASKQAAAQMDIATQGARYDQATGISASIRFIMRNHHV
jgi:hypothetical protein